MRLSEDAKRVNGVADAAVVMATRTNKEILRELGLIAAEGESAGVDDLVIAFKVSDNHDSAKAEDIATRIEALIQRPPEPAGVKNTSVFSNLDSALEFLPGANLAVVSVPGQDAKDLTMALLKKGVNVHLFSDHVPVDHELELKRYASENGLFVLGPGAGTSIIGGKAVAFANAIRRGDVGIVAAAGTGLQEVSVLIDRVGLGLSHGLGVGGNDMKEPVDGIMTLSCIRAFEADPRTRLIILVSKPPDRAVAERIMNEVIENCDKDFVICFLGNEKVGSSPPSPRVRSVRTLHAAALETARMSGDRFAEAAEHMFVPRLAELEVEAERLSSILIDGQRYMRGLYTGGTLLYEALVISTELLGGVYSNTPIDAHYGLPDPYQSVGDSLIDMGDEVFTEGRAHPMIDPTVRKLRLLQEARNPTVAVIMLDFVLGYGCHSDPVGAMLNEVASAQKVAKEGGRELVIVSHVCGTETDPQRLEKQEEKLRAAGVWTFNSNALMAFTSALVSSRCRIEEDRVNRVYTSAILGR